MMRQSEFKMKLDPELGRYARQHIYGEGMMDVFKVIPWFCIAHSLLRITLRHPIWRNRKLPARLATTKGAFAGAYPCTKQVEEKT